VDPAAQRDLAHDVHELIAHRWSPYGFAARAVSHADLLALFEAARWAPSCFNEQPWRFIVATQRDPEGFSRLLSCLTERNRLWARSAPVLVLGVVKQTFTRNDKPNKAAAHDLGLAAAHLSLEATARGLAVHQMIGIDPDRARDIYDIPDGYAAWTALAIGYVGAADEEFASRDAAPRSRRPQQEFVFAGSFGTPLEASTSEE